MNENLKIVYVADKDVNESLDKKIRALLSKCFPHDEQFKRQRFAADSPKHRFIIEADGELIANLAVHEKEFIAGSERFSFLGIAEVCVDERFRGRGIVWQLLEKAEKVNSQIKYSILLGEPEIYQSSGYIQVDNIYFSVNPSVADKHAMVKCLLDNPWPHEKVVIEGAPF